MPDLRRIESLRQKLLDELLLFHSQEVISGEGLQQVLNTLQRLLPDSIPRQALQDSLVELLGQPLDRPRALKLAWRLAGNTARLKAGHAVPVWSCQREPEWVPVVVVRLDRESRHLPTPGGKREQVPGGLARLRVLAGTPAGMFFEKWWTQRFISHHRQLFGFARFRRRPENLKPGQLFLGFEDIRQLAGFRLSALLTPASCARGLDCEKIRCPSSLQEHNKELLTLRARLRVPCPRGYSHACHVCWLGQEHCRAGCHPRTFVRQHCPACHRNDAFLDPDRPEVCVDCRSRGRTGVDV